MSLCVNVFVGRPGAEDFEVLPADGCEELAGPESWRTVLWGAASVRQLGLTLLPSLAGADIYASGDELTRLNSEVETILQYAWFLADATGIEQDAIAFRAGNIRAAYERASAEGGGVVIW